MTIIDCRTRAALACFATLLATYATTSATFAGEGSAGPASAAAAAPTAVPQKSDPCGGPGRLLATLDRPTVGYSACAVPKGAIVLEDGYQNQSQSGASAAVTATYPQGFQRVGVAERLELDLIGPAYNRQRVGTTLSTGYNDLGLGFKYELPQAGRFTYAIDGLFQAVTGTGGFSAGGPTSAFNIDIAYAASPAIGFGATLAGYATSGRTAIGTTPQGATTGGLTARYGYVLPSFAITAQIPNYYQFYAEIGGQTKIAPDQGGRIFTDFGLQKLLGPSLEVDGEYGISFTPVSGSRFHYVGVGVGLRVRS